MRCHVLSCEKRPKFKDVPLFTTKRIYGLHHVLFKFTNSQNSPSQHVSNLFESVVIKGKYSRSVPSQSNKLEKKYRVVETSGAEIFKL